MDERPDMTQQASATLEAGEKSRRGISLFRIAGISIHVDPSWLVIFLLIVTSLALGYFPSTSPDQSTASYWIAATLASLFFFASILLHELAHSWMALRAGIPVPRITLFLFGGVSHMGHEAKSPAVELRVAIVGPLMSLALALFFYFAYTLLPGAPWLVSVTFQYLAWINLALGVFNLLPGFPLDGGRVLRALVWWTTGDLRRATRVASDAGKTLALALMVLGGIQIFLGGLLGGLWLILIAMFLRGMARQGYEALVLERALENVSVDQVMVAKDDVVTVSPETTLQELVDEYVLRRGHRGFPVVEAGRVLGLVSIEEVRRVDRERWSATTVREHMTALDASLRIAPHTPLLGALKRLAGRPNGRLLVMEGDELVGLITSSGLTRFVELRRLLDERGSRAP